LNSLMSPERSPRLVCAEEGDLPLRNGYFSELIQSIFLRDLDTECRPVMFTSPSPGAGVSFTCSYIVTDLAGIGHKVLLADAQTLVRLARRPAEESLMKAERIDITRLWVLGQRQMGTRVMDERFTPSSVSSVLAALRDEFTHIVIDAPALSASDDAITLAAAVHGTIFVAHRDRTARKEIVHARQQFISLGGRVLGTIFNARSTDAVGGPEA
jgi:Mrp family chromosome partitioning ATPase